MIATFLTIVMTFVGAYGLAMIALGLWLAYVARNIKTEDQC